MSSGSPTRPVVPLPAGGWSTTARSAWRMASVSVPSSAILALPIALAGFGPLAGVAVVLAVMAFKLVTISALVDAASRCSSSRIQGAGHGGVARQLLGRSGVVALVGSSALYRTLSLLGALVALADIAHALWGVRLALVPPLVVGVAALDFAGRRQVNTRVTGSLLVVGSVIVAVVAAAGATSMDVGRWFERGSWGPALVGAVLTGFVAEAYVLEVVARTDEVAEVAARRRGILIGVVIIGALSAAWVLVVSALVPVGQLAATEGTVVSAVEGRANVVVVAATTGLCVLVSAINVLRNVPSLGLQVQEWLPRPRRQELEARLGADRLAVRGRGGVVLGVTVLAQHPTGLDVWVELQRPDGLVSGLARLAPDGSVEELAVEVVEARPMVAGLSLVVLHHDADRVGLSVRASRSGPVEVRPRPSPLRVAAVALGEDEASSLSRWLLRRPDSTLDEMASATGLADGAVEAHLAALRRDGALTQRLDGDVVRYRLRLGGRSRVGRASTVRVALDALAEPAPAQGGGAPGAARSTHLLSRPAWALVVSLLPGLATAAVAVGLLASGAVDLAGLYGVSGVLTVTAFGGALPLLLAVAARRRGDMSRPTSVGPLDARALRLLGLATVAVVLVGHATVVWTSRPAKVAAALVLAGLAGVVVRGWREGRFATAPSLVVLDDRGRRSLHVWSQRGGATWPVDVQVDGVGPLGADGSLALDAAIPPLRVTLTGVVGGSTIAVTCLRRLPDGTVHPMGVTVVAGAERFDVALLGGRAEVDVDGCDHLSIVPPDRDRDRGRPCGARR